MADFGGVYTYTWCWSAVDYVRTHVYVLDACTNRRVMIFGEIHSSLNMYSRNTHINVNAWHTEYSMYRVHKLDSDRAYSALYARTNTYICTLGAMLRDVIVIVTVTVQILKCRIFRFTNITLHLYTIFTLNV